MARVRVVQPGEIRGRFPYGDHVDLARQLLVALRASGPCTYSEGHVWRYSGDRGTYEAVTDGEESRIVQGFSGEAVPSPKGDVPLKIKASDVKGAIALAHHQIEDERFFAEAPAGIAFTNGFVRVTAAGAIVEPHSPSHRARFSYPFAYEPGGKAPLRWLKMLYGIFRDDADREERIQLLHEFFGGCLIGVATRYDKAIFLQGDGDDGKSTVLDIFRAAFPPDTCSAVPPHKLSGFGGECDYFRAQLAGKLANIVSELPEADLLESTGFKAMVSGDNISARAPCKPAFTYRPVAGMIFAANALPTVGDMSKGFWRRVIVMAFTRSFDGDPERDPLVADAIIASELPAIVAALIIGAVRLLEQGTYTTIPSSAAAMTKWRADSNPVIGWLADRTAPCAHESGSHIQDLYDDYRDWAPKSGHKTMAKNTFAKRLNSAGFKSVHVELGSRYPLKLSAPTSAPAYPPRGR